ncbi:MAG: Eco57I restriction-modification methylase domain-containing protein [Chloroflexi bacterium]|nr:Eco57I restriction-modification methylase domain-containing protein [Chloroflexota bacterium]MCL5074441.1 Eco57I restriction-modification methylase domain-containing protein [Chloroflexota bacterium]
MAGVEDIGRVHSREALSRYLSEGLGYRVTDVSYPPKQLAIPSKPSEAIQSVHLLSDYDKAFQVYLLETTSWTRTTVRSILEPFYRHHPAGDYLFIFTKDYSQLAFVSPLRILRPEKPMPALQLRILPLEPANVYHTDLEVLHGIALTPEEQQPEIIRRKHEEAFSVERVTSEFFETYEQILERLKGTLAAQRKGNDSQVHGFAQRLLNRLMFLYFLQRKGWLKWGDGTPDKRYMRNLWQGYCGESPHRGFYRLWLSSLFFYAFNRRTSLMPLDLPGDIRASFQLGMPFLNGGLFVEDDLDKLGFDVPDEVFVTLFDRTIDGTYPGLLERYNFTIQESLPLEVEVAVDPEMLGRVYESLINKEDRHQAGIFYTPRIEIDYMCRLSLIEYLHEATALSKDTLIPLVMSPLSEDGRRELDGLASPEVNRLRGALDSVRVVDPAVGSGSFLVGMMNVMVQLYRAIAEHQGHPENEFALKKRIISQNLYGVDVKDWAVRVCELRLWLSLIIESEESQMDIYNQPLLPNLTFKARQGDSLVEEIAGIPLSLRADYAHIPPALKRQIQTIVEKKADYFRGDRSVKKHNIEYLEHQLLRSVLDAKVKAIDADIRKLESPQEQAFQAGLEEIRGGLDITQTLLKQQEEARAKVQPQIDALRGEKGRLQKVAASIGKKGEKDYFLWDIDFAEVFLEKGGFDICIGNPPYVRQEEIAPPLARAEDYDPDKWREIKKGYKERLENAVKAHWGKAVARIDKKSDLYIYFYYRGLNLLRPGGVFCFINSNSWLDVGYGGSLQQFLLRNINIRQIIDNQARRSFKESDVNTVIVLLQRPKDGHWEALEGNISKFTAYRVPFEAAVNAENLLLQEWTDSIQSVPEFRVYPISQEDLWLDGLETPEETETPAMELGAEHGRYSGGKWGGKYLRAPDIFFTILEKGKDKLVRLGDIAEVRFGIKTGANEFFYLQPTGNPAPAGLVHVRNGAGWEGFIEEEFLKPVIKGPQEVRGVVVRPEGLRFKVFMCDKARTALIGTRTLEYVSWGERAAITVKQGSSKGAIITGYQNLQTLVAREPWYDLGAHAFPDIVWVKSINDCHRQARIESEVLVDQRLYEILCPDADKLNVVLNSTLTMLSKELSGRVNLGEGALDTAVYEAKRLLILHPHHLAESPKLAEATLSLEKRDSKSVFEEFGLPKPSKDYSNIHPEDVSLNKVLPDRRELDRVVFEALGLTEGEQVEVYRAVVGLVKNRLAKARSV